MNELAGEETGHACSSTDSTTNLPNTTALSTATATQLNIVAATERVTLEPTRQISDARKITKRG